MRFNIQRIYELEHVDVLLGWVNIPLTDDIINQSIDELLANVNKMREK